MPNPNPPHEIGPEDLTKAMLERNVAPTYDQVTCLIGERKAIAVHDPEVFEQSLVAQKKELDAASLAVMHKLNAPVLIYHQDIIDIFDRIWGRALRDDRDVLIASILKDDPGFDLQDQARVARVCRTCTSEALMSEAMSKCARYSAHFVSERIKHGLDPGVHSAVTALPDVKADGSGTMSLISIHGLENDLGDERLFVDLYRP